MNAGDLILLPPGLKRLWGLTSMWGVLVEKVPRQDCLEYDWKIFADNRYINAIHQIDNYWLTNKKNKNNIPT